MSNLWHLTKRCRHLLILSFCSFCLVWFSGAQFVTAQTPSPAPIASPSAKPTLPASESTKQVDVVFEGQTLFKVTDAGGVTAQDRADIVMLRLNKALEKGDPNNLPTVSITQPDTKNLRQIRLNKAALITVTEQDIPTEDTVAQTSERWAEKVRTSLHRAIVQRTSDYLGRAVWRSLGLVAATIGLQLLLTWGRRRLIHQIDLVTPKDEAAPSAATWAVKLLVWMARTGLWIFTILYVTHQFPVTRRWSYEFSRVAITSTSAPILTLGNVAYSLTDLMTLGLIIIAWVILSSILSSWLKKTVLKAVGVDRGTQEIITTFIRYSLIAIGILVLLQAWGINISSLAILASALGLGIGFGLQDLAKNISGGFVLLFERLIQVGDFVEVSDNKGTIERIGTRSTQIRTPDNISIIVPNVRFLEEEVINWSHSNPISRLHIPIGVAYGTDPYIVKATLLEVAHAQADVLTSPAPQVFFKEFGDNSLNFELLVWTERPDRQLTLMSDLNYCIHDSLQTKNIEVPFPQRDLHIKSANLNLSPDIEQAIRRYLASEE